MKAEGVFVLGTFKPDDLIVSVSESSRKIDPVTEEQVDALWEEKKRRAQEEGRVCYNGVSYRLNMLAKQGDKIRIDFGLLEYKTRQALASVPGYHDLPDEYCHKGCYSGATVKTSDGRYLIVELSGKSMNRHSADMLGGIMEKPSEIETGEDVFNCLYVELEEEACLKRTDIKECYLRSIFQTPNTHVCFYFEVSLSISSQDLLERFARETKDQDIQSLQALTREEYLSFLVEHASPAKQLMAEILQI